MAVPVDTGASSVDLLGKLPFEFAQELYSGVAELTRDELLRTLSVALEHGFNLVVFSHIITSLHFLYTTYNRFYRSFLAA